MPLDAFFSGPGFDRADALRGRPDAIAELAARADARQLEWSGGLPGLDGSGTLAWRAVDQPDLFLGLADGAPRFAAIPEQVEGPRAAFGILGDLAPGEAPVFAAALSLGGWHVRHRFCANCGTATDIARGGWSRACPACSAEHYPRVDPVVIMLAEHGGSVLLGRQPQFPPGRYTALAGFVEVGETIEVAVARELKEEAGIEVSDVRYVASQPWPFPSSLMIGCVAQAADTVLAIDTTELEDARWFSREEVAAALADPESGPFRPPPRFAIARTLMEHWLAA